MYVQHVIRSSKARCTSKGSANLFFTRPWILTSKVLMASVWKVQGWLTFSACAPPPPEGFLHAQTAMFFLLSEKAKWVLCTNHYRQTYSHAQIHACAAVAKMANLIPLYYFAHFTLRTDYIYSCKWWPQKTLKTQKPQESWILIPIHLIDCVTFDLLSQSFSTGLKWKLALCSICLSSCPLTGRRAKTELFLEMCSILKKEMPFVWSTFCTNLLLEMGQFRGEPPAEKLVQVSALFSFSCYYINTIVGKLLKERSKSAKSKKGIFLKSETFWAQRHNDVSDRCLINCVTPKIFK